MIIYNEARIGVLKAFEAATKLRELMLTQEELCELDIQALEQLLDSVEAIAISLAGAEQNSNENITGT